MSLPFCFCRYVEPLRESRHLSLLLRSSRVEAVVESANQHTKEEQIFLQNFLQEKEKDGHDQGRLAEGNKRADNNAPPPPFFRQLKIAASSPPSRRFPPSGHSPSQRYSRSPTIPSQASSPSSSSQAAAEWALLTTEQKQTQIQSGLVVVEGGGGGGGELGTNSSTIMEQQRHTMEVIRKKIQELHHELVSLQRLREIIFSKYAHDDTDDPNSGRPLQRQVSCSHEEEEREGA